MENWESLYLDYCNKLKIINDDNNDSDFYDKNNKFLSITDFSSNINKVKENKFVLLKKNVKNMEKDNLVTDKVEENNSIDIIEKVLDFFEN
jgi:hypothetical protein